LNGWTHSQLLISKEHYSLGMGQRIPNPIRQQAIKEWLKGESRDKIANELKRSQGAVSGIIKEAGKDDPQSLLLREVAVQIKNLGIDIESFAPLVRLRAILRDKGLLTGITGQENFELVQDRLEAVIVTMEVLLFQRGLSPEEFYSLVTDTYNFADKVGIPLNEFPLYIEKQKDKINDLTKKTKRAEKKKQDILNYHKTTLESLKEYNADKPFLVTLKALKEQLAHKDGRIGELEEKLADAEARSRELEEELDAERHSKDLEEQNKLSVFDTDLEKAKEEILPGVEIPHTMIMLKAILKHPGRYRGVINRFWDLYIRYQEVYPTQTDFSTEANTKFK
jgi:DNA repair exonuclease SbcCD ATPase subunit